MIALLGEDRGHRSHQEPKALRPMLPVPTTWVATDSGFDVASYDGVWLVPGSPYADDAAAALRAVSTARELGVPFLGTCGMQYAVVAHVRDVLRERATHAESDGVGDDNVVCSLRSRSDRRPPLVEVRAERASKPPQPA